MQFCVCVYNRILVYYYNNIEREGGKWLAYGVGEVWVLMGW